MFHASQARKRQASKAAVTSAHFRLPARTFAAEAWVEDVVDAAEEVDEAAEPPLPLPLPLPLVLAIAAPTGRIKPPSTPGGDVLEPDLAAAAL
jgi:hypothetical protein